MIADVEDFFAKGCGRCPRFDTPDCATRRWAAGLAALRKLCRDAGLYEGAQWGRACYAHAGRNVAVLGAFRDDFRISFFDAALLTDEHGVLARQGPQTRHPDTIRFTDAAQVAQAEGAIRALLAEAMGHAAAGRRPPATPDEVELPEELAEALVADAVLAAAFSALTRGRRNGYAIEIGAARRPETRVARIAKHRARILAGKGLGDL